MKHGIKWRLFTEKDATAVSRLHAEQESKLGIKLDLPTDLMERPILLALVGETDGVITHAAVLEAEAEIQLIGTTPFPPEQMVDAEQMLASVLRDYQIRIVRAFVPEQLLANDHGRTKPSPLTRILGKLGFTREHPSMVQFFRWL